VNQGSTVASQHGWTRFVSMQNYYNLIYQEEEREMIPLCCFLLVSNAGLITGSELLIDGGIIAAMRAGLIKLID
jgi:hypothetical protein